MNERLQLALIVGCGFVIGLEAPSASRLVLESWTGPYAAESTSLAHHASSPRSALAALDELRMHRERDRELLALAEFPMSSDADAAARK